MKFAALVFCMLVAGMPVGVLGQTTQNQPSTQQPQPAVPGQPTLPPINRDELPSAPSPAPEIQTPQPLSNAPAQNAPSAEPPQPTGTAAAEAAKPSGNAVSRPAGAAIAPAKQRQVRSMLIKMGFIAGAGVALGTVYGLSAGSPSRVPNTPR